ncbi:zona pellucida glycoprotein d isoform X2 [Anoplopoma fimbria]|uniref:zona pellucida glycoprotein d isoform X2 n=1 Tax=Anoplopoma fimbria TaxID=229290 RepID=UPI0023ED5F23|nr:zona pellucida glycoprotein d isoform X2 [Anoplopoma fimbria]
MIPIGLKLSVALVLLFGFTRHRVEGICSVEHCTNGTRCVLSKDERRCKCAVGYYADQCDKNAHIKVICGKDFIGIRAKEDYFKYHNVPLESLHLPNRSCRAQREVIDGVPYFMSNISKDEYKTCGGRPLKKNRISYSLSLQSDPQVTGNIIRNPVIKLDYTCIYPSVRRISLHFPVIHFSSEMIMHVDELDAKIQMMLYTDHSYSKAYSSAPTIELRDKVYVEVSVTEPADFFLLRVDRCWATQSPQPNATEELVYTLLLNGCVNDETVSFLNVSAGQSGRNGESSTIRYSFDMFRFTAEPHDLYLHCTVELCIPEDYKSCTPNCNSIRKREAVRADPSQGLLSYGPIRIEMPDRPQSSILATVVLPVAGVWTVGFFLIILITVAKAGSRRLTKTEEH